MKTITGITLFALFIAALSCFLFSPNLGAQSEEIRVGLIGLDTSHSVAFARILNDPDSPIHVPGARIVAAFPGGSPDIPSSIDRLPGYREELESIWGVSIFETIPELLKEIDAVILTSVDGRTHLEQVGPVFEAGKRVFIDKPLAASLEDVRRIVDLSEQSGVPFFSASSLRFFSGVSQLLEEPGRGDILAADAFSPAVLEPHHPDLYWYGIHGVEILYTVMGTGCQRVFRMFDEDGEVVVGIWEDGRIGTFRGIRKGPHDYGVRVVGSENIYRSAPVDNTIYRGLVSEIVKFFQTGVAPIPVDETIELFEFMSAAQVSREEDRVVSLEELR